MKGTRQAFCCLGQAPGVGLRGAGGARGGGGGGSNFFFQTWSCGISNWRVWWAKQNASKIFILGSNWWPWGEVKRSNIKYQLPCQFQRFLYQTLCMFSQIKENILNIINILLLGSCPRVGTCGCWGVKNFNVGICDGTPSTAHSSYFCCLLALPLSALVLV